MVFLAKLRYFVLAEREENSTALVDCLDSIGEIAFLNTNGRRVRREGLENLNVNNGDRNENRNRITSISRDDIHSQVSNSAMG